MRDVVLAQNPDDMANGKQAQIIVDAFLAAITFCLVQALRALDRIDYSPLDFRLHASYPH